MFNTGSGLDSMQEKFISFTQAGVYAGESEVFSYSEQEHQIGVSTTPTYQFRIQTDSQDVYLFVEMAELPTSVDEVVEVSIQASGIAELALISKLSMTVLKVSSDEVWLWDSTEEIGFIVTE